MTGSRLRNGSKGTGSRCGSSLFRPDRELKIGQKRNNRKRSYRRSFSQGVSELFRHPLFLQFGEVIVTEISNQIRRPAGLPVLVYPRGLGRAASGSILGRGAAGNHRQADRCPSKSLGGALDRQEPADHPGLHRRLCHGPGPAQRGAGPQAGRRGTRLGGLGHTPTGQRPVLPEAEQAADPKRPPGAGHPQAPPFPQRAGHRRQRRRQDPQLCEAKHPGGQHQLCHHRPQIGGAAGHWWVSQKPGL